MVRISAFPAARGHGDELVDAYRELAQVCEVGERPDDVAVVSRWRDRSALDAFTGPRTDDALGQLTP